MLSLGKQCFTPTKTLYQLIRDARKHCAFDRIAFENTNSCIKDIKELNKYVILRWDALVGAVAMRDDWRRGTCLSKRRVLKLLIQGWVLVAREGLLQPVGIRECLIGRGSGGASIQSTLPHCHSIHHFIAHASPLTRTQLSSPQNILSAISQCHGVVLYGARALATVYVCVYPKWENMVARSAELRTVTAI